MKQDKRRASLTAYSGRPDELNRIFKEIERRLDQVQGIGQHADMHGGKIVKTSPGTESRQALTADFDSPSGLEVVNGLKVKVRDDLGLSLATEGLSVKVQDDMGLDLVTDGLGVKLEDDMGLTVGSAGMAVEVMTDGGILVDSSGLHLDIQPAIADPVAVSAVTINAGADQIDRAAANTALTTLVSEINAIKDVVIDILTALRTGHHISP